MKRLFSVLWLTVAVVLAGSVMMAQAQAPGTIITVAGDGRRDFSGDGGPATQAGLSFPTGVFVDGAGNLYIADFSNLRIRKVDSQGIIITVAGNGDPGFSGDGGPATAASLNLPSSVFVDSMGNLYIADFRHHRIRKVDINGIITTIAGDGFVSDPVSNVGRFSGDGGPATQASLNRPQGVFADQAGNIYIADSFNHRIRKVDINGIITTMAGNSETFGFNGGGFSGDGGPATAANLNLPSGVFGDSMGNLYISDLNNHRIRKVDSQGIITTVAGNGDPGFSGDGGLATTADLSYPSGVFVDGMGNLYIADSNNNRIRRVTAPTRATLSFSEAYARPGGQAIVHVSLRTDRTVAGVQFGILPYNPSDPTIVHLNGLINSLQDEGFTASAATDADGITTVLLFSASGGVIPPGESVILHLVYDISPQALLGAIIELIVEYDIVSDPNSQAIPHELEQGAIHIGLPGDTAGGELGAGNGRVDILDIIKVIQIILGRLPFPQPFSFEHFVADANVDGSLNILDIVTMVNVILYRDGQPKVVTDEPSSPVTVSLGELRTLAFGQASVPIVVRTDGVLAGAQAIFTFDPAQLQIGTPQLVGRASGMTIQSQVTGGTLRLVIYSAGGQGIAAGNGDILLIPVTVLDQSKSVPSLELAQIMLASRQARSVPVALGTSTVKVSLLPGAFALKSNRPNPFNPNTTIAYDVPRQAHITLVIYNLLGQEVIRLVDMTQVPGRYTAIWNGQDGHGRKVASGIYLYRLASSTGFDQVKRMTLLK